MVHAPCIGRSPLRLRQSGGSETFASYTNWTKPMRAPGMSTSALSPSPVELRWNSISQLPHDERIVLILFYFEKLSLEEIAVILGRSEDEIAERFYLAHVGVGTVSMIPAIAA
jgi:DNA-directed RNA polymerase specialized sigma24 family protein